MRRGIQSLTTALALLLYFTVPVLGHPDVGSTRKQPETQGQQPKPGSKDDIDAIGTREIGVISLATCPVVTLGMEQKHDA
jgi:hypothetical protein